MESYHPATPAETAESSRGLLDEIIGQPTTDSFLTRDERNDFDLLDRNIRRHIAGFKELGLSLREVRDRRLYREQYRTFEAYLDDIGLKRQRAYELIEAATIASGVSEISDIEIRTESHAAALADVPADQRPAVLKVAVESTGGKITAKAIKKAAEQMSESIAGTVENVKAVGHTTSADDPITCQRTADGAHSFVEDDDGRCCQFCGEPFDGAVHGDDKLVEVEIDLPAQPRWSVAAGEVVAALQSRNTAENRHRAITFIWRITGLLTDLESGRMSIDDLRTVLAFIGEASK